MKQNFRNLANNFTAVPNELLNSTELSAKAKFIYIFLISKPDTWSFSIRGIASQLKEGKDWVQTALNEIKEAGLLEVTQSRENKKFGRAIYTLHQYTKNQCTENQYTGNNDNSNTIVSKTKKGKINNKKFVADGLNNSTELATIVNQADQKACTPDLPDSELDKLSPQGKAIRVEAIKNRADSWYREYQAGGYEMQLEGFLMKEGMKKAEFEKYLLEFMLYIQQELRLHKTNQHFYKNLCNYVKKSKTIAAKNR